MKKQFNAIAILLVLVLSMVPVMASNTTDDFEITEIELNDDDVDILNGDLYGPVYAGEELEIEVSWEANLTGDDDDERDAKITVKLADEKAETDWFTIRDGWTGKERLTLDLDLDAFDLDDDDLNGNDFDIDDLEKVYRLHVEMEDENGNTVEIDNIRVRVVNQRNLVQIYDVNFPNSREVKAGEIFQANIGVKNLGHKNEEDVKITVSIPELGLSTRSDRFDLYTEEEYLEDRFDDDDFHYKLYRTLFIPIPLNTISGVYDVEVEVEYDDGDKSDREVYSLTVSSGVAPSDAVISVADTSEQMTRGKGAVYKLMFANLGNQAGTYTIEVSGVSGWGTARVDPQTVTVGADETREVFIFVSADENANLGSEDFNVKVKTGNSVVKEFDLTANIVGATASDIVDVKDGLQIGFLILLVILVILGIILVAKKLGKNGKEEEPFIEEDQTYY